MKKRILAALLTLVLAAAAFSSAAAASNAATKVPTLSATFGRAVSIGHTKDLSLKASTSGFLDLWITDESGNTVRTYCKQEEVHSQTNYYTINTLDDSGNYLTAGTYTINAILTNQYGTSSKQLTRTFKINGTAPETGSTAIASGLLTADSASALGIGQGDTSGTANPDTSAAVTTAGVTITSDLSYSKSSSVMVGVEGFQIGVGVSDYAADDGSAWCLTNSSTDEEIWTALTKDIISVDVSEKESAYIYDSTDSDRKQIGTISGYAQGLHVILTRDDGWSLVEAYRNEDSAFVRGYIKTKTLETHSVSQTYGIVIDKASQTLIVYQNGRRIGSCKVSTGLATTKYLSRETPAGEFLIATRQGNVEYYKTNQWSKYTIRINGNYNLMEIPTTKKNGSDFSPLVSYLGVQKSTRGSIVIAHEASADGGINAEFIWNMTDKKNMSSKARIKVIILDDKPRYSVPATSAEN